MMTRDSRKTLKLVGLKTLHRLFAEVLTDVLYYANKYLNYLGW